MQRFAFIYILIDPRDLSPKINKIRYVGKSFNPKGRFKTHLSDIKGKTHKSRWIIELLSLGLAPIMKIVEKIPYERWQEREIYWIKTLKSHGAPLTNETNGGDGIDEYAPDIREKISKGVKRAYETTDLAKKVSESCKGKLKPGTSAALRGRKRPDIAAKHLGQKRPKISEALKDKKRGPNSKPSPLKDVPLSESAKEKIRQANLGKKASQETKDKMSATRKGVKRAPFSPEARANMSAAAKERYRKRKLLSQND